MNFVDRRLFSVLWHIFWLDTVKFIVTCLIVFVDICTSSLFCSCSLPGPFATINYLKAGQQRNNQWLPSPDPDGLPLSF